VADATDETDPARRDAALAPALARWVGAVPARVA
jgi:hypothetical protein